MMVLDKKLVRDLWRLRGQVVTVALVVASGIAAYVAMRSSYESFARAAHADMIDQFLWSQKMSQDADAIEKFFFFLLVECRKRLLAEPARAEALSAREILRLLDMMRETNVNRRLLLDNVFLSLSR